MKSMAFHLSCINSSSTLCQWGDGTKEEKWVSEANKYGAESFKEFHYFRGKLDDFEAP